MFSWLRSRDHKRDIFRYWDGKKWRRADPLAVARALERNCKGYTDLLAILRSPEADIPPGENLDETRKMKGEAAEKLVQVTRQVFGLELLECGGLTEAEAVGVLTSYLVFMEELARRAEAFR